MGKVFIHVGLPKTATTTLQAQFFPSLNQDKIKYLGIFQPRSNPESVGYRMLMDAINNGCVEKAKEWLVDSMDSAGSILLSEECILVSDSRSDWRSKLKNLGELLDGLEYEIIVTVREPVSALFSFYVELYSQFSNEKKSFIDIARFDPRMEIYHYSKLFGELSNNFDLDHVYVKKFEEICSGDVGDLHSLLTGENVGTVPVSLNTHNKRRQKDGYFYTGKSFTVKDVIIGYLNRAGWVKPILKPILKPFLKSLDLLKIRDVSVPELNKKDKQTMQSFLKKDNNFLKISYGITYE